MSLEGGQFTVLEGVPEGEAPRRMHCGFLPFEPREEGQWLSRGGPARHPHRRLATTLELAVPPVPGAEHLLLLGAFALHGGEDPKDTEGAAVEILDGTRLVRAWPLLAGVHYTDADDRSLREITPGDGSEIKTVGCCLVDGRMVRLDLLSIDLPPGVAFDRVRFADRGTTASFAVLEVAVAAQAPASCPFRGAAGGISLAELGSVVRVRDRVRFARALDQLSGALEATEDLDEARSEALTFVAIVTAGRLESGGPRSLHRVQLEAARRFDRVGTLAELRGEAQAVLREIAGDLMADDAMAQDRQIDRALTILARNFAGDVSDDAIARQVGLSTSHFRHLFREVTGQPFHRYVVSLRLEQAKAMLEHQALSVSKVAEAVGFGNLAHFSRAFTQRFGASPTALRKGRPSA